jgi:GT2 family glycosyltransferase
MLRRAVPTTLTGRSTLAGADPATGSTHDLPRVSVVVPCYKYGHFLPGCVDSVLSQPGVRGEVLIVDDASPDGSAAVARALADADERVRAITRSVNLGHIRTYNEGLNQVDGDYVVLLSADDLLAPGALRRAVDLFEAHPNVGLVYGHPRNFTGDVPAAGPARVHSWSTWSGRQWIADRCRRGRNPLYSPEVVLRGDVRKRIGDYDISLPHSGDLDMWMRAAAVSDVGRVNGPDQAYRRIHGANMSETTFAGELADFRERVRAFDAFFDGPGSGLPEAARWRAEARRSVARAVLDHACGLARSGGAESAQLTECLELAGELVPNPARLRQWRELEWRARGRPSGLGSLLDAGLSAERDLRNRVIWHRWRWSGV